MYGRRRVVLLRRIDRVKEDPNPKEVSDLPVLSSLSMDSVCNAAVKGIQRQGQKKVQPELGSDEIASGRR